MRERLEAGLALVVEGARNAVEVRKLGLSDPASFVVAIDKMETGLKIMDEAQPVEA